VAADLNDLPCHTDEMCAEMLDSFKHNPPRMTNETEWSILYQNEVTYFTYEISQLTDEITMDNTNSTILYVIDHSVAQYYAGYLINRNFKYKNEFNDVLLQMQTAIRTIGRFNGLPIYSSAFQNTNAEHLSLGLTHLRELFMLFICGTFISLFFFFGECLYWRFVWRTCQRN
jgi:hypothetical protein